MFIFLSCDFPVCLIVSSDHWNMALPSARLGPFIFVFLDHTEIYIYILIFDVFC